MKFINAGEDGATFVKRQFYFKSLQCDINLKMNSIKTRYVTRCN